MKASWEASGTSYLGRKMLGAHAIDVLAMSIPPIVRKQDCQERHPDE